MIDDGVYFCYEPKDFIPAHMQIIGQIEAILMEYKGFKLTVRQMFYQGVARDLWKNNQHVYNRIGKIISEGRLAGLLPWNYFEDRGRNLRGHNTFESPRQCMARAIDGYKTDLWATQEWRPEVWIEKQALEGVIGEICSKLRVDFYATKGYNSQSEQWRAGQRFAQYIRKGQRPIVFHLGDRDPSGIDMTRDNRDRLAMFTGTPVIVQRIALNQNQIDEQKPPPNYVKIKADGTYADSRANAYVEEFGEESFELDALSPKYIRDLIEFNILQLRDEELWDEALQEETSDIMVMTEMMIEQYGSDDDQEG